jgi:hypothetical protein
MANLLTIVSLAGMLGALMMGGLVSLASVR